MHLSEPTLWAATCSRAPCTERRSHCRSGLVGVAISFFLGILIGGVAGYFGGTVDEVVNRLIDLLISIPSLPLWMGLSAALPRGWAVAQTYLAITIILSLLGWTTLARVVRGKFLALRESDFVVAARIGGRRDLPIIFIHMVPSFLSHIIAALTLTSRHDSGRDVPQLSRAGHAGASDKLGCAVEGGPERHTLALAPWLMIPGLFVIATVLAFNFVGDGLRDAADPYAD